MRIDEINLLGQFKITGNTGSNSQAIGMSGGSTSFIDVVASGGGSSQGLVQRSGYNYVIVEATGDALANGVKLQTAYTNAVTLLGQIGTPDFDNRVSILLTPGDYNLGAAALDVGNSYIDIVGISQNPLDTIVRASATFSTIGFGSPGLDFGLYNIDLRSGGIDEQVALSDTGSGSTYLRMKNVVISGNGFYSSGTSFYSFYDLDGEFEDITVLDGCNFAMASNSLTGTYKNIKIGDAPYAFFGYTTLTGTYKNITISNLSNYGFYSSNVSGIFENIKINGGSNIFPNITSGYFKNIIISGSPTTVFSPAPGTGGIFEDIEISNASDAFTAGGIGTDGTFKNIKIGDVVNNVFTGGSANILGTFSNIEIGNAGSAFSDAANISGYFKDIKVGNVTSIFSSNTDLTGTYENITIGNVDGDCFISTTDIIGTFKNIKVGNVGTFFSPSNDLNGTYENITVGDVTNYAFYVPNSILGTFKNISVKSTVENFFYTGSGDINGTFDQIYIGNCGNTTFRSLNILTGTFSNIEIVNCGRTFVSADVNGYYDGITIGAASNDTFNGITTGTFKNIKIGSCASFFTSALGIQPTLVENIEVGVVSSLGNFIDSGDALGGTYKNIKVGSVTGKAFTADFGITGTYSNIEVGSCVGVMFYGGSNTLPITVNVDNLFVGTASTIFDPGTGGGSAIVTSSSKFNKLDVTGNCFGFGLRGKSFLAKLTNSRINMIGRNDAMFLAGGQIEICKILTDASTMSGSGQVIYTMTNQSNTVSGATQCISDTSITS